MSEEEQTVSRRLIPLGEIVGTHGVRGLLRFHPYNPASRILIPDHVIFLTPKCSTMELSVAGARAVCVRDARPHGRLMIVDLEGVATMEAAEAIVGSVVSLDEADLPTPDAGQYYAYQLEGLEVHTVAGDRLGIVASLFPTGSNDVLVVRDGDREYLIPVIADVVRSIDLDARRLVIQPIAGLLD